MSKDHDVVIYVGRYTDEAAAMDDFEIVKKLHASGAVGAFDAVVVIKDSHGHMHERRDETPARRGAVGGAALGALAGLLFPPTVVVSAAVGAALGAFGGHAWAGILEDDLEDLYTFIDNGEACLVVVGVPKIDQAIAEVKLTATKSVSKHLSIPSREIDPAVQRAIKDLGGA